MKSIKEFFAKLNPKQKKLFVAGVIVLVAGGLLMLGYQYKKSGTPEKKESEKKVKLNLDPGLLEKAYSENVRQEFEKKDAEFNELKSMFEELKRQMNEKETREILPKDESPVSQADHKNMPSQSSPVRPEQQVPVMQQPPGSQMNFPPPPSMIGQGQGRPPVIPEEKPKPIGGIETITGFKKEAPQKDRQPQKTVKRTVYLPPSFMEATLLTGFSAATMQSAKTYEKPLLLRVKDLAVLPNEIKADLKGCFIIASAYGDLSDERAHARLVNLSCLSRNGESVIDAQVKGFLVDSDGKIGLAGDVVTKMGALLGRSVLSGFFGGVGDAFKAASTTTVVSTTGTTQTIDSGDLMRAGIGGGLSKGFGELQKFYLEMAKQTFPIVEVGSAKSVTVVIEQGVELEIKDYCVGGFNRDCSSKQAALSESLANNEGSQETSNKTVPKSALPVKPLDDE